MVINETRLVTLDGREGASVEGEEDGAAAAATISLGDVIVNVDSIACPVNLERGVGEKSGMTG
jgi:hypothetical protein